MPRASAIEPNVEVLSQGEALLRGLSDGLYRGEQGVAADARSEELAARLPKVGPHFRHCIDFYHCFLDGAKRGEIDYDARARCPEVECSREAALGELVDIRERISRMEFAEEHVVRVQTRGGWCGSTVRRELEALLSHTIHHYALIAVTLRWSGHPVPSDFGVAPSTLDHWRTEEREGEGERSDERREEASCAR